MSAPELLKKEMPLIRMIEQKLDCHGYTKGTEEWYNMFSMQLSYYRKFGWSVK